MQPLAPPPALLPALALAAETVVLSLPAPHPHRSTTVTSDRARGMARDRITHDPDQGASALGDVARLLSRRRRRRRNRRRVRRGAVADRRDGFVGGVHELG